MNAMRSVRSLTPVDERPSYPTWIKSSRIRLFWLLSAAIVAASLVVGIFWLPGLAIAALAFPFIYIAIVITMSSYRLSLRGDDLETSIHQLIIEIVGDGDRLLDIGCGSGELIITFAKVQPGDYLGPDFWPDEWVNTEKTRLDETRDSRGARHRIHPRFGVSTAHRRGDPLLGR